MVQLSQDNSKRGKVTLEKDLQIFNYQPLCPPGLHSAILQDASEEVEGEKTWCQSGDFPGTELVIMEERRGAN